MSLKARLEKLETKANPQDDKDLCVFLGLPSMGITGYRHGNDVYMRLDGESDDDLEERVKVAALAKEPQNGFGIKVAVVRMINEDS